MNNDIFEGQWKQLSGKVKTAWGELTDDDVTKVDGNIQKLSGLIQEKYGRTKEQAEKEIQDFCDRNR